MSLWLIHFVVQQKLTRHYKVIILQLIRKTKTPPGRAREFSVLASWVFSPHLAGVSDRSPDGGARRGKGVGDLPHLGHGVGASAQTSLAHVTPGCSTSARYHMALSLPCSHLRTMSPAPTLIPPSPLPRVSSSTQPYPASSVRLSIVCLPHQDVSYMEAGLHPAHHCAPRACQCLPLSVAAHCSAVSSSLRPHGLWNCRLPCPSLSPRLCSNSRSLSQ